MDGSLLDRLGPHLFGADSFDACRRISRLVRVLFDQHQQRVETRLQIVQSVPINRSLSFVACSLPRAIDALFFEGLFEMLDTAEQVISKTPFCVHRDLFPLWAEFHPEADEPDERDDEGPDSTKRGVATSRAFHGSRDFMEAHAHASRKAVTGALLKWFFATT
jgi:hypothetical protein